MYFPTSTDHHPPPTLPLATLSTTTYPTFKQEANEQHCRSGKNGGFAVLLRYFLLGSTNAATYEPLQNRILRTFCGGGPSTVRETRFIPRSSTRPSGRFSSFSGILEPFGLILRNSSQSDRTKFMCRSKAKKVPMKMRPSARMTRTRCCRLFESFLLLPSVWGEQG